MNHQAVSFSLHAWFGVVASLAIIWVTHNYGKFKISVAIPKLRTLPRSLISNLDSTLVVCSNGRYYFTSNTQFRLVSEKDWFQKRTGIPEWPELL